MFVWVKNSRVLVSLVALSLAAPAVAQENQPDPIANTPPSLRGFNLPPSDPQPDTRTQGPVDGETAPPRPIVQPDTSQEQPAPRTQVQPQAVTPRSQPVAPVRQTVAPQASTATPADGPEPLPVDPDTPVSSDDPQPALPVGAEPQGPDSIPIRVTESSNADKFDWTYWIVLAAVSALLLGAFTYLLNALLRRRKPGEVAEPVAEPAPVLADSPPLPQPVQLAANPPMVVNNTPNQSSVSKPAPFMGINFTANSASATLINAVLGFQLIVRNVSDQILTDVRICGDMIAAHSARTEAELLPDADAPLLVLHDLSRLGPEETCVVTGELRLPLSAISPLVLGKRALFVPVVRLAIAGRLPDGSSSPTQLFAYLVGQESNPPQGKLAPLRLDLGPRDFVGLGQRRLAA